MSKDTNHPRLYRPGVWRRTDAENRVLLRVSLNPEGSLSVEQNERVSTDETGEWLDLLQPCIACKPAAPQGDQSPDAARGAYYDLQVLYDRLNAKYFGERINMRIIWGRRVSGKNATQIQFGSCNFDEQTIRIHPALDTPGVPRFFIDSVLCHELLHADIGLRTGPDGRTVMHGPDFQAREKEFEHHERALRWQNENLHRFISAAPAPSASPGPDSI